jgi:hypothetical protein
MVLIRLLSLPISGNRGKKDFHEKYYFIMILSSFPAIPVIGNARSWNDEGGDILVNESSPISLNHL